MSANAAIDRSNADGSEHAALLMPMDPDASAAGMKAALDDAFGGPIGVVVTDTHGRPFRRGNIGVAVGVAGFEGVVDMIGARDLFGRELKATVIALADELAAAAALVSGETSEGLPIVLVRGVHDPHREGRFRGPALPRRSRPVPLALLASSRGTSYSTTPSRLRRR